MVGIHRAVKAAGHAGRVDQQEGAEGIGRNGAQGLPVRCFEIVRKLNVIRPARDAVAMDLVRAAA